MGRKVLNMICPLCEEIGYVETAYLNADGTRTRAYICTGLEEHRFRTREMIFLDDRRRAEETRAEKVAAAASERHRSQWAAAQILGSKTRQLNAARRRHAAGKASAEDMALMAEAEVAAARETLKLGPFGQLMR